MSGRRLGPYTLLEELGAGATSRVWRVQRDGDARAFALKVLTPLANATLRARFEREGQALRSLHHPGIVAVHEVGEVEGRPYLVMDLVEGRSLQDRLDHEGPLAPVEAAELVRDVAAAVAFAHARGLLHRDLKPDNVLLGTDGRPRLTDFGLVRDLVHDQTRLSATGAFLGTPGYWPPEQASGQSDVDERADVYGLGGVLYAALTGLAPQPHDSFHGALHAAMHGKITSAREYDTAIPHALDAICLRALRKRRESRYPSAEALREALDAFVQAPPRPRRSRVWVGVGVCALAAPLAVAVARVLDVPSQVRGGSEPAPRAREPAEEEVEDEVEVDAEGIARADRLLAEALQERPPDVRLVEEAVAAAPEYGYPRFVRGVSLIEHDPEAARVEFEAARDAPVPYTAPALDRYLGLASALTSRWEQGVPCLTRALAEDPDDYAVGFYRGVGLRALHRLEEAAAQLEDLWARHPDAPWQLHFNLGGCYNNLGRWEQAADAYTRAVLQTRGRLHWPLIRLGQAYLHLERYDEALEALEQARELAPTEPQQIGYSVRVLLRMGQVTQAAQRLAGIDEGRLWSNDHLVRAKGLLLKALGRREELREFVARASEAYPQLEPEAWLEDE